MKKTVKKLAAVGLTLTSVMSLVACGSSSSGSTATTAAKKEVTKPDKFTVMIDGTVVTLSNGGQAFRDQLATATGLDIEWVQPDHSGYYDAVANAFNSESTMPDVVILSQDYYTSYAASGFLWDMTDAWANSETKNSGRLISTGEANVNALKTFGEDGKEALYGFTPCRGNGCVTYVKKNWIEDAGLNVDDFTNKTMTFDEYYSALKKMQQTKGHFVISAPGFIGSEAPYTNYLPEFFQQAQFTFYKDSTGKYVDGFSEQAMKDALQRIATGVKDGVIDVETVNNSTSNSRDKFYATEASNEAGVFTYWAGTWAYTLKQNLDTKNLPSELVEIKPITELGKYAERIAPAWAITTHATNPDGIFTYFIDKMLDGGEVQQLWTYGAKGTHWDTKAETVTLQGKEDKGTTYTEGQFHFLPSPEKPTTMMTKNNFDPLLSLGNFTGEAPGKSAIPELAQTSQNFFNDNSQVVVSLPTTEAMNENIGTINTERKALVAKVALGQMTIDDAYAEYDKVCKAGVDAILKSLNK